MAPAAAGAQVPQAGVAVDVPKEVGSERVPAAGRLPTRGDESLTEQVQLA